MGHNSGPILLKTLLGQPMRREIIRNLATKGFANRGFSLTEILMVTLIIGLISAVAIPAQIKNLCRTETNEAAATISSIKAIIAAYIDETGAFPDKWDDLSSISAIMTNNGTASGALSNPITLPNELYEVSATRSQNSIYEIEANRLDSCPNRDVYACFNASTGASELIFEKGEALQSPVTCN